MVKELTAKRLEIQVRKSTKDQRIRQFSDIAIQGTNDYSIVSKRSVEKLYATKIQQEGDEQVPEYFHHFVKKSPRRSPAINRGYWIRMEAIKKTSYQIILNSVAQGKKVTIINLGAGYDPLAFQYLDPKNSLNKGLEGMLSFVDVDYPELNKIKIEMIKNSKALMEIVGAEEPSQFENIDFKTKNYAALSCNLKDIDLFLRFLENLNFDDENITKIYIAEVSIAYMLPQYSDPVIQATSKFPNTHFLLLEQLLPAGIHQGFARTMLSHFSKLNSALNSVTTYPTIAKQIQRFKDLGYKSTIEAIDLNQFWGQLPKGVRDKVADIEAFDEWEEFILFAQHYLILHAANVEFELFELNEKYKESSIAVDGKFKLKERSETLARKFLAGAYTDDTLIINGGAFRERLNSTLVASNDLINSLEGPNIKARMAHSLSAISNDSFILAGGRTSPVKCLTEVWELQYKHSKWVWEQKESLPAPRTRHSTFTYDSSVYLYGGNYDESTFIRFKDSKWEAVTLEGELNSKKSSAIAFNGNKGIIIGGMNSNGEIESSLHLLTITENGLKTEHHMNHPLLNRYSAKAEFISEDEVLLFGGVCDLFVLDQCTTIVKINLSNKTITPIKINNDVWKRLPLLVGFQLLKYKDTLFTVGGGAVCYSFGSIWNDLLVYGNDKLPEFNELK